MQGAMKPNRPIHAESEIEEKIRHHYHQPKGVERFGIEPVPTEKRTVRWFDIFAIIFGFALNPGSIMVGGMAVASGLSSWARWRASPAAPCWQWYST
jgi:cytosine/uracil/thiamine/allantoin permease